MRNPATAQSIFELSQPGRRAAVFPASDVPQKPLSELVPSALLAKVPVPLPELAEPDVIRHFVNLSTLNMCVDTHFYPLGSCTMKYNPKRHERLARIPELLNLHPHARPEDSQGILQILFEMQEMLAEIAGLPAVSLQPAAGAQGELAALLTAEAYFRSRGERRTKVLFPSSAHGTNPASAALAGFECVQLKPTANGLVDVAELRAAVNESTAVFMVTNPNTLGIFEREIAEISLILHDVGALVYIDGANMNAIAGIARPGDFGGDMMHYNVHKTFTGPHGAGGPGAGPIAVRADLAEFLPGPVIEKRQSKSGQTTYAWVTPRRSIGRMRSYFGNIGILLRGWFYLRTLGAAGVRRTSEDAVLNANYLRAILLDVLPVPHGDGCLHEFVASAKTLKEERGITAMEIAKRLLDYGYHAPTVYFPLVVPEALMIEPTETESKETLDAFAAALRQILTEDAAELKTAPRSTFIRRPDEVAAGRNPIFCFPET